MRRKPSQITTGRLQSLRLFSTLLAISLIEVQKRTRCLRSAGTRGGLIHSLIKPRGGPHLLCRFSFGFIESNVQALYDPARGKQNLANSP